MTPRRRALLLLLELFIDTAGITLLYYAADWMITLAVVLIVWGANLMNARRRGEFGE